MRAVMGLSQKQMAEKLGIAVSTYQHYERAEREAPVSIIAKVTAIGFSLEWFLTGSGQQQEQHMAADDSKACQIDETNPKPPQSNVVEMKHTDVVKRFKDKAYALALNMELLELEQINPDAYRKVGSYIKGVVEGVRIASTNDRRRHERREDNQDPHNGQNRRSGNDRRKVSGSAK